MNGRQGKEEKERECQKEIVTVFDYKINQFRDSTTGTRTGSYFNR